MIYQSVDLRMSNMNHTNNLEVNLDALEGYAVLSSGYIMAPIVLLPNDANII
jgi:hypothetical protein